LAEDSDDEIDAKVVKQAMCQFPALCEVKHVQKTNAISYAGMASKPAVLSGNAFDEAFQVAQIKKIKTKTKTIVTHNVSKRWVDMMSDSDDDDDDEEMSVSEISNDCW
jgi:isoaspartyl peptidase/L-asparaginase-like protein (Ntn-hydrolase superfamily)